jgi:hypothetical protein
MYTSDTHSTWRAAPRLVVAILRPIFERAKLFSLSIVGPKHDPERLQSRMARRIYQSKVCAPGPSEKKLLGNAAESIAGIEVGELFEKRLTP